METDFLYIYGKKKEIEKDSCCGLPMTDTDSCVNICLNHWSYPLRLLCFFIWGLLVWVWILREFGGFKWVPSYILKLLPVWDIYFFLPPLCSLSVWSFKVIPGSDQWHIFIISVVALHGWLVGIVYRYHVFLTLYAIGKHFLGTVSCTL